MAKRCLPSINVEGVTYPLMQVNDFSICNTDGWEVQLSSGKPSYVTDEGTEFYSTLFNRAWVSPSQSIVKNIERQKSFLKWFDYYGQGTTNVGRLQLVDDTNNSGFCQVGITQSTVSTGFWHICIIVDDALCLAWAFHYDLDGFWKYAPNDTKKRMLYDALVGITRSGGAGSGYIGNSLVSRKKMVGYNVPTSSDTGTKTESVNTYSSSPETDTPKVGNGFARIKFLRATNIPEEYSYISNINELWTWYNDNHDEHVNFYEYSSTFREEDYTSETYTNKNPKLYTHYGIYIAKTINDVYQNCHDKNFTTNPDGKPLCIASLNGIMTINVDTTDPLNVVVTYSKDTSDELDFVGYRPNDYLRIYAKRDDDIFHFAYSYEGGLGLQTTFSSLSDAIWYIYRQYSNINLFVDGVMWVKALS